MNFGFESGSISGACVGSITSHAVGTGSRIINCYNKATVTGSGRAGGIADNYDGIIWNCVNMGETVSDISAGITSNYDRLGIN